MPSYYSAEIIEDLEARRKELQPRYRALQERFILRAYCSERGREYALQGFCRRLDVLVRSINFVFNVLPPAREDIPDTDDVVASTMLIQSFVINAAGCLDNLAWVWVYETAVRDKSGRELDRRQVGFGSSYRIVQNSLPKRFRKYLRSRRSWLKHLTEFRHSLAHRIPLYIPPYMISEERIAEYNKLGADALAAANRGDFGAYDRLIAAQEQLGRFLPWMTHSPTEKSPRVVFHQQMLQDYATVEEFGYKMLEALADFDASPPPAAVRRVVHLWFASAAALLALLAAYLLFSR